MNSNIETEVLQNMGKSTVTLPEIKKYYGKVKNYIKWRVGRLRVDSDSECDEPS